MLPVPSDSSSILPVLTEAPDAGGAISPAAQAVASLFPSSEGSLADPGLEERLVSLRTATIHRTCWSLPQGARGKIRTEPPHPTTTENCQKLLEPLAPILAFTASLEGVVPLGLRLAGGVLANSSRLILGATTASRKMKQGVFKVFDSDDRLLAKLNAAGATRRAIGSLLSLIGPLSVGAGALSGIVWSADVITNDEDEQLYTKSCLNAVGPTLNHAGALCTTFGGEMIDWFSNCPTALERICRQAPHLLWTNDTSITPTPEMFGELASLYEGLNFFFSNCPRLLPKELGILFFKELDDHNSPLFKNFEIITSSFGGPIEAVINNCRRLHPSITIPNLKELYHTILDLNGRYGQLQFNLATCAIRDWLAKTYRDSHSDKGDSITEQQLTSLPGATSALIMLEGMESYFRLLMAITHRMCCYCLCQSLTKSSRAEVFKLFKGLTDLLHESTTSYVSIARRELLDVQLGLNPEGEKWRNLWQTLINRASNDQAFFSACSGALGPDNRRLREIVHQLNWYVALQASLPGSSTPNLSVANSDPPTVPSIFSRLDMLSQVHEGFTRNVFYTTTAACDSYFKVDLDKVHQTSVARSAKQEAAAHAKAKQLAKQLISAEAAERPAPPRKVAGLPVTQPSEIERIQPRFSTWFGASPRNAPVDVSELLVAPDVFSSDTSLTPTDEKTDEVASQLPLTASQKKRARKKKKEVAAAHSLPSSRAIPPETVARLLEQARGHPASHLVLPPMENFALWTRELGASPAHLTLDVVFTETDLLRRMMESLCHYLLLGANLEVPPSHNLYELAKLVTTSPKINPHIQEEMNYHLPLFSLMAHANNSLHYPFSFDCHHSRQKRLVSHLLKMSERPTDQHHRLMQLGIDSLESLTRTILDPTSKSDPRIPHPLTVELDIPVELPPPLFLDTSPRFEEGTLAAAPVDSPEAPSFVTNLSSAVAAIEAAIRVIRLLQLTTVIGEEDGLLRCSLRDEALQNGHLSLSRLHEALLSSAPPLLGGLGQVELARRATKEFLIALLLNRPIYVTAADGTLSHIVREVRYTNSVSALHRLASLHVPSFNLQPPPPYLANLHLAFNYPHPYSYHDRRPQQVDEMLSHVLSKADGEFTLKQAHNRWLFPVLQYLLKVISSVNLTE